MALLKFSLLTISLCILSATYGEKVNMTMYYESLCPYCDQFIVDKLWPGMGEIGDFVNLELVPFGNADIDPVNKSVTCQHGPRECYGNKVHACAIENHMQKEWLDFIYCSSVYKTPDNDTVNEKCAEQAKISWREVKTCVDSEESDKLISHYGEETLKADVWYTPHIVFNGVVNRTLEQYSRADFTYTVCLLLNDKPRVCSKYDSE